LDGRIFFAKGRTVDTIFKLHPEIIVGRDTVNRAGSLPAVKGMNVLIVTEHKLHNGKHIERLVQICEESGARTITRDEIPAYTTAEVMENAALLAKGARCDTVVGFGALTTQCVAKLVAMLASSPARLVDLLDGGAWNEHNFLPYLAIPTAAADPFLFTEYFPVIDPRDRLVKLIRCPRTLCTALILDSGLFSQTGTGGTYPASAVFDGLCTALEAYCSLKANFLADAFLEQALSRYASILQAYGNLHLEDLQNASVDAGLLVSLGVSTSAAGIGTALAYALSGRFPLDKTWCSTVLLPHITEKLIAARPEKMARAAMLMGEAARDEAASEAANKTLEFVRRYMGELSVPSHLKDLDLNLDRLVPVAEAARALDFAASSPWTLSGEDTYDLLKQAF